MLYEILRKIKGQVNIMMWLTIISALVIVSGVYTYARYTYHTEVTGVTVTVPGIGYCAYNGMTLADCVLVTDADEPYETVSIAKTAIEAKIEVTSFSEISETDEGLYDAEDDYGTSYYFRGAVEDNYVEYAGYIWRIIRVNGDGSVRMILQDNYTTSAFNENYDDNAYVGYMYGTTGASTYSTTHSNTNDSTIKTVVDGFYEEKLDATDTTDKDGNKYSAYLSDTLFCNDRSYYSGTGIGTITTHYSGYDRLDKNKSPSLICTNKNDEFTVKTITLDDGTKVGNEALSYPIGLITADEVSMAGGVYGTANYSYYLYTEGYFWTMTPLSFSDGTYAHVFDVYSTGNTHNRVYNSSGVRPVVNLSSDVYVYSGTGTQDDPYQVSLTKRVTCTGTLSDCMLLNSTGKSTVEDAITTIEAKGTPDFSTTATTDEGMYAVEDDYGTSYYYRGAVEDNYVYFAGYYWRIIRRNGDGSVRLIYDGTTAHANGDSSDDRKIGTSVFNENYDDNTYEGYMYGIAGSSTYSATHTNTNNSTIKEIVDEFYATNIKDKKDDNGNSLENYLSDTLFCNDRNVYSGTGYGLTATYYYGYNRLGTNKKPTLTCTNKNDRFTVSDTTIGNGDLTYSIGLITADEVAMAGGVYDSSFSNNNYYLYIGYIIWTMTPNYSNGTSAREFYINTVGYISSNNVNSECSIRPVINISSSVLVVSGNGTYDSPYQLSLK